MLADGTLTFGTDVWAEGMESWAPLSECIGRFNLSVQWEVLTFDPGDGEDTALRVPFLTFGQMKWQRMVAAPELAVRVQALR